MIQVQECRRRLAMQAKGSVAPMNALDREGRRAESSNERRHRQNHTQ